MSFRTRRGSFALLGAVDAPADSKNPTSGGRRVARM
ncbi:hypothetical protein HDA45_006163 [Amycolatopsis umgeniensis]|uniref:Uncharacterized protein n=1 Tax=Amycolatopsis umgeniensis TaxID=336628 RepID=A0A841B7Q4_9PSEU|nr:hypothetical protein [Amycolatopsis umgeniensis]